MKNVDLTEHLAALEENSPWEPTRWGTAFARGDLFGHDHLPSSLFRVPEGVLVSASCTACGGYRERIVGLTEPILQTDAGLASTHSEEVFRGFLPWAQKHVACEDDATSHRLPEELIESTDALLEDVGRELATGEPTSPWFLLQGESGTPICGNIPLRGPDPAMKKVTLARWHAAIRSATKTLINKPRHAVFVAESWVGEPGEDVRPSESPNRKDVVRVEQVTRQVRRIGVAPIRRSSGTPEDGPGELGELRWYPTSFSRLSLGLLAPVKRPSGERRARQRLGLRF
jgi:hypothetical protein